MNKNRRIGNTIPSGKKWLQKGFCNIAFSLQKGCIATTEGNLFAMTMQHFKNVALQPHRKTLLQCCTFIATRLHGNLAIYSLIRPCIKLAKHLPGNVATCSPGNVAYRLQKGSLDMLPYTHRCDLALNLQSTCLAMLQYALPGTLG